MGGRTDAAGSGFKKNKDAKRSSILLRSGPRKTNAGCWLLICSSPSCPNFAGGGLQPARRTFPKVRSPTIGPRPLSLSAAANTSLALALLAFASTATGAVVSCTGRSSNCPDGRRHVM